MNAQNEIVYLYVDDIIPNRFQPREIFDEKALKELSDSIKEHGVIQPIIVRKVEDRFEIIAGERRYKASILAGLTRIPAIVRDMDDAESAKVALLENLQRKNLTPIEEARTFQKIIDLDGITQEELGRTMGKTQSSIANKLRLLSLPNEVQEALLKEQISERHARSLLKVDSSDKQIDLLNKVLTQRLTVRDLDLEIDKVLNPVYNEIKSQNAQTLRDVISIPDVTTSTTPVVNEPEVLDEIPEFKIPSYEELTKPRQTEVQPEAVTQSIPEFTMAPSTPTTQATAATNLDIDQIRQNTEDIFVEKEKPVYNVDDLVKQIDEKLEEQPQEPTYKFVPTFDDKPKPAPQTETFEINIPKIEESINQTLSNVNKVEEQMNINKVNYKDALNVIRTELTKLREQGHVILAEELDFENRYQIVIKINKD